MQVPDVNVLVHAYREDSADHEIAASWFNNLLNSDQAFGLSDLVCSAFLRIVTHPRIHRPPSTFTAAVEFVDVVRSQPNCFPVAPGERHWRIFTELCLEHDVRGALVTDAYFAALAIESGSEWITFDGDYARFTGLRWRRPSL